MILIEAKMQPCSKKMVKSNIFCIYIKGFSFFDDPIKKYINS